MRKYFWNCGVCWTWWLKMNYSVNRIWKNWACLKDISTLQGLCHNGHKALLGSLRRMHSVYAHELATQTKKHMAVLYFNCNYGACYFNEGNISTFSYAGRWLGHLPSARCDKLWFILWVHKWASQKKKQWVIMGGLGTSCIFPHLYVYINGMSAWELFY